MQVCAAFVVQCFHIAKLDALYNSDPDVAICTVLCLCVYTIYAYMWVQSNLFKYNWISSLWSLHCKTHVWLNRYSLLLCYYYLYVIQMVNLILSRWLLRCWWFIYMIFKFLMLVYIRYWNTIKMADLIPSRWLLRGILGGNFIAFSWLFGIHLDNILIQSRSFLTFWKWLLI